MSICDGVTHKSNEWIGVFLTSLWHFIRVYPFLGSWDGISLPGMGCKNPFLGWGIWDIYPILGWDAIIPSWDGMYGISHLGMEIILPILGWDGKMGYPILGWDGILNAFFCFVFAVVNPVPSSFFLGMGCPILGWDARIPSWDGMYGISHPGMGCNNPILGWDVWVLGFRV